MRLDLLDGFQTPVLLLVLPERFAMAAGRRRFAYVTLLTRTSYLPGLLVLWFSLREVGSRYPLVVMVTPSLPLESRDILQKLGVRIKEVEPLRPAFEHHLTASDSRFADTWTKLRYAIELQVPTTAHAGIEDSNSWNLT